MGQVLKLNFIDFCKLAAPALVLGKLKNFDDRGRRMYALHITRHGDYLTSTCTDRYSAYRAMLNANQFTTEDDFRIHVDSLGLLDVAKSLRGTRGGATVNISYMPDADCVEIECGGVVFPVQIVDGAKQFDVVERLFAQSMQQVPASGMHTYDASYMAKLISTVKFGSTNAEKKSLSVQVGCIGEHGLLFAQCNGWFDAIIMPKASYDENGAPVGSEVRFRSFYTSDKGKQIVAPAPAYEIVASESEPDSEIVASESEPDFGLVPRLTEKMKARYKKGLDKGFTGADLATFMTGDRYGQRFEALAAVLTGAPVAV